MVLAAAGINSGIYKFFLVLHLLAVIVGFGGVVLNGLYAAQAKKRGGREAVAVAEANFFVSSKVAEYAIYAVFILGMALVGLSDKAWKFDQKWVSAAMGLYIVGLGIAHGVLIRGAKRMNVLLAELADGPAPAAGASGPPPQVAEVEALEKRLALAGAVNNIILVVIVALMVWKPK